MDRRTLLRRGGVVGLAGLAGCTGDADDAGGQPPSGTPTAGSPTPEPSPTTTPARGDETYTDDGAFSFEYGVVTHNDPNRYDGTLRISHIRTPVCAVPEATPTPAFPGTTPTPTVAPGDCPDQTEALLAERDYRVTDDLSYDLVDAPVAGDIDTYRLEWTAAGGTDITPRRGGRPRVRGYRPEVRVPRLQSRGTPVRLRRRRQEAPHRPVADGGLTR